MTQALRIGIISLIRLDSVTTDDTKPMMLRFGVKNDKKKNKFLAHIDK